METKIYLETTDFSVSGETFQLHHDVINDMLVTYPKPATQVLSRYYESADYISHSDAKRTVFERVYHLVRKIAIRRKLNLIDSLCPTAGNLLDIGAGTGDFLSAAAKKGWKATGVEPNSNARAISQHKGVSVVEHTTNMQDHSYDIITMWHVLEHVPDPEQQITELKRLLKPGGYLVIAVPNFNSFDANYYGRYWAAYDVPRHLWHFSRKAIINLFRKQGFELQEVLPMKFDAFYVSMLSEKYKTGKANVLKAFLIGAKSNLRARSSAEYSSHIYILKEN